MLQHEFNLSIDDNDRNAELDEIHTLKNNFDNVTMYSLIKLARAAESFIFLEQ